MNTFDLVVKYFAAERGAVKALSYSELDSEGTLRLCYQPDVKDILLPKMFVRFA